jgi:hypothetical protein
VNVVLERPMGHSRLDGVHLRGCVDGGCGVGVGVGGSVCVGVNVGVGVRVRVGEGRWSLVGVSVIVGTGLQTLNNSIRERGANTVREHGVVGCWFWRSCWRMGFGWGVNNSGDGFANFAPRRDNSAP